VGWGSGEDEEAGAILKVHASLGDFLFWHACGVAGGKFVRIFAVSAITLPLSLCKRKPLERGGAIVLD
jgi:hypothetical protein